MILALLFPLCAVGTVPASAASKEMDERYREPFAELYRNSYGVNGFWQYCWVDYYHYAEGATSDETTPDFVAVFCSDYLSPHSEYTIIIEDYCVSSECYVYPYGVGTYIYTPSNESLYTLTEAYAAGIDGVEEMLSEHYDELTIGVTLIGDLDRDHKLTVKDATKLQKCLVGVEEFESADEIVNVNNQHCYPVNRIPKYISDFNRDRIRNVRDATAIQKYVAGLE